MTLLEKGIVWSLTNLDLVLFIVAVIFIVIHRQINEKLSESEIIYRWVSLFALGFTCIFAAVMHVFYADYAAANIGWAPSPFQFEVGMADLAFGIVAVISFRAGYGFRLATVCSAALFLWGDAAGHIFQAVKFHNFSVGNMGSWFWMDLLIPLVLFICIVKLRPE